MAVLPVILAVLTLAAAQLGGDEWGDARCPCKPSHSDKLIKEWNLTQEGQKDYSEFGIGCHLHFRDTEFAKRLYQHETAGFLECDEETDDPWCWSRWCYIDETKKCDLDFWQGTLGKVSHATCGNLQKGWPQYAMKSLAAKLKGPLRVLHIETTLKNGYMGNACDQSGCTGLVAGFWKRSLDKLENAHVTVKSVVIKRSNSLDDHFKNITPAYENYSEFYKQLYDPSESHLDPTNFDLCAFATGLGWVDLCSGDFALTHQRQEMTYLIELYTTPAFMVSKSTCHRIFEDTWWWVHILSDKAWAFLVGTVFLLNLVICLFDGGCAGDCVGARSSSRRWSCSACWQTRWSCSPCWQTLRSAVDKACRGLVAPMFHEFLNGSARTISDMIQVSSRSASDPDREKKRSTASRIMRYGLNLFLLLSTTIYFSSLTTDLISEGEPQGEFQSFEDAQNSKSTVNLCLHQVYQKSIEQHNHTNIKPMLFADWEELKKSFANGRCHAAIIEDEAWKTFRSRGELCEFYKPDTPTFFMPTGAPVSRRAYRTLETFRFEADEITAFEIESDEHKNLEEDFKDKCPEDPCKNKGVPWRAFDSMAALSVGVVFCGLLVGGFRKCSEGIGLLVGRFRKCSGEICGLLVGRFRKLCCSAPNVVVAHSPQAHSPQTHSPQAHSTSSEPTRPLPTSTHTGRAPEIHTPHEAEREGFDMEAQANVDEVPQERTEIQAAELKSEKRNSSKLSAATTTTGGRTDSEAGTASRLTQLQP